MTIIKEKYAKDEITFTSYTGTASIGGTVSDFWIKTEDGDVNVVWSGTHFKYMEGHVVTAVKAQSRDEKSHIWIGVSNDTTKGGFYTLGSAYILKQLGINFGTTKFMIGFILFCSLGWMWIGSEVWNARSVWPYGIGGVLIGFLLNLIASPIYNITVLWKPMKKMKAFTSNLNSMRKGVFN